MIDANFLLNIDTLTLNYPIGLRQQKRDQESFESKLGTGQMSTGMSTRTIVRDFAHRTRCIRRTYQTSVRAPPPPNRNDGTSFPTPSKVVLTDIFEAGILSRLLAPEKFPFHAVPRPKTATVYSPDIYIQSKIRALREEDPTPAELDSLFRMMDRDSPQGELKPEALIIWRELRSRGVIPTQEGYVALLKVFISLVRRD